MKFNHEIILNKYWMTKFRIKNCFKNRFILSAFVSVSDVVPVELCKLLSWRAYAFCLLFFSCLFRLTEHDAVQISPSRQVALTAQRLLHLPGGFHSGDDCFVPLVGGITRTRAVEYLRMSQQLGVTVSKLKFLSQCLFAQTNLEVLATVQIPLPLLCQVLDHHPPH